MKLFYTTSVAGALIDFHPYVDQDFSPKINGPQAEGKHL